MRGELGPSLQTLPNLIEMSLHRFGGTEMRQTKSRWLEPADLGEAVLPGVEINIRRWGERRYEGQPRIAQASSIAGKRDAGGLVKVADVVRRVAGRVYHFDFARTKLQRLAARQRTNIFLGHREKVAEESLHFAVIKTLRAA